MRNSLLNRRRSSNSRRMAQVTLFAVLASILMVGPVWFSDDATGSQGAPTVSERTSSVYDVTIEPGEKAVFKWDLLNPTNTTWEFTMVIVSDNSELTGTLDRLSLQVFSGQSDTVTLKVTSDAAETTSAKFTVVFTIRDLSTNVTLTAYKSAEVRFMVTHGVDFHGMLTLQPSWIGIEDNDLGRVVILLLFYLFLAILTSALIKLGGAIVSKTKTKLDDIVLGIIQKPIFILIILYGLLDAVATLEFLPRSFTGTLNTLFGLGVLLTIIYMAYKLFKGVVIEFGKEFAAKTETEIDDILIPVVEKIGVVLIGIFGIMGVLSYFGIDVTMAATGLGVAGLVIAFAAQNTISNFFGGIFILLDRPFKVNDVILIDTDYCRVEHIGLRSTRVYNLLTHTVTVIPNDQLANSKVTNISAPDLNIRVKVLWEAPYGIDADRFSKIMLDVVKNSPKEMGIIKDNPKKNIWCQLINLKDSSMQFAVGFWVDDFMKQWEAAAYVRTELYRVCQKEHIEIPFPQLDVHIKDQPK